MPISLSNALTYVTPAPVEAILSVLDYKMADDCDKPLKREKFNNAIYTLLTTTFAVTAFLASSRLKSQLGSRFNDAVTLGTIFYPNVLGQTLFARTFVASFKGGLKAGFKNPTELAKNVTMGLLACAASSNAVGKLYADWIVQPIVKFSIE